MNRVGDTGRDDDRENAHADGGTRRDEDATTELRSFGRRRGRKLSPRQERLLTESLPPLSPALTTPAPAALHALFPATRPPCREVWLEIGFGGAEHLIWQAEQHPDIGIIGCEPFEDGVVKALSAIEDKGLRNVLVHADDARPLLRWLPEASLARAFVLFPDPWPKRKHTKRRLVNHATLALLARALRTGAELRIATDIGDYARTILIAAQAVPDLVWTARTASDWRGRPDDWPPTRYEAKAIRESRKPMFFSFRRR